MKRLYLVTLLLATLSTACLFRGEDYNLDGQQIRLTVLHTSDIHSRLVPFQLAPSATDRTLGLDAGNAPFGGGARLAYVIRRERERANRVMHIDSGDVFQGAPIFNDNYGVPEFRFHGLVGADVVVLGNHEFDAGVPNLVNKLFSVASYQVLSANYEFAQATDPNNNELANYVAPYSLHNIKGLRIAVIGVGDTHSLSSIGEGGNSARITPIETNEIVRSYVNLLHSSMDLVFVASHSGVTGDEELIRGHETTVWRGRMKPTWGIVEEIDNPQCTGLPDPNACHAKVGCIWWNSPDPVAFKDACFGDGRVVAQVPGVKGIDAVFGGHLHIVLNPPKVVMDPEGREVPIVHSGAFAKYLGRFDMVVGDDPERGGKRILTHKYQVFPVDDRLAQHEDTRVKAMLEPYRASLNRNFDLGRVIGFAPTIITRFSKQGNGDSGLGNLVTASMQGRRRVDAEFAVTNTLGIRDHIYPGPITLEDMFNIFPFENSLVVMYLSATEVQELADYITFRSASRGCNAQAQVSGITFTMNCGQVLNNERDPLNFRHPGEEIVIDGQPIQPTASYKLATNDYIANGGSGFRVLKRNTTKQDTEVPMRNSLIDYIQTLPTCGSYDLTETRYCLQPDDYSQTICKEIVDCERYIDACRLGCATGLTQDDDVAVPTICQGTNTLPNGGCDPNTDCTGDPSIRGAYADTACVVSAEDGRLRRKTSDNLDAISDVTGGEDYGVGQ